MTKSKKIIIIAIIILLVLVPISTLAITKIVVLPSTDEKSIEEANKKDTERALEEKAKFAEEHIASDSVSMQQNVENEFSEEELQTFAIQRQQVENRENEIKKIMNKYYPEEFNKILSDIESSSSNQGLVDIKNNTIPKEEAKLYDIVIKVLEEKNLSENEENILKDFIRQQQSTINKDNSLKSRANSILQ